MRVDINIRQARDFIMLFKSSPFFKKLLMLGIVMCVFGTSAVLFAIAYSIAF